MKVKVRVVQKGKPLPPEKVCISTGFIRRKALTSFMEKMRREKQTCWRASGCLPVAVAFAVQKMQS